jgi:uncharacterized membrane protein
VSDAPASPRLEDAGTLGLTPAHAAALAWVGGWFSGLVIWWLDPPNRFVRVQALQALLIMGGLTLVAVGSWGLGLMMAFVTPALFRILTWLSTLAWMVLAAVWLAGTVQAWRGKGLRLPLLSGWADRLTSLHSTLPAPPHPL